MEASSSGDVPCTRMSVSTAPAAMALTVIPGGPSSRASEPVNAMTAALAEDNGGVRTSDAYNGDMRRELGDLDKDDTARLHKNRGHVHDPAVAAVDHVRQKRL